MLHVTLELHIRPVAGALRADATLRRPDSQADAALARDVPLALDEHALLAHALDPDAYGRALSTQLFADQRITDAWRQARALADGAALPLVLRLRLAADAPALHALRWETLREPLTDAPLATDARVRLVRALDSADTRPIALGPRPELSALLIVASPRDLARYGMADIDTEGEVGRVRAALGDIPLAVVGDVDEALHRRATIGAIREALRQKRPTILCLISHGKQGDDDTTLWLEDEQGNTDRVAGSALSEVIAQGDAPPLLAVLVACAGGGALAALGPRLAQAGAGAVVAMQDRLAMRAAKQLLPVLFAELAGDGRIDRAVALGRAALHESGEWWVPALWLRTDGRLWDAAQKRPHSPDQQLRALLHDHSGFIASRMEAFVGRAQELAEIRDRIAEKLPTGGYVTITGQAGQGKSSIIARLIAEAIQSSGFGRAPLREQLQQPQSGVPICHFIPFSPGPDHQVGLLRNLIARLCLTYDLPDFYAASDSRPALRDYFAAALRDLAKQGRQEVIYLDGLDQIEEDASGVRDLSFLPEEPPEGIVFVLGTRPNDTLKPLELRTPQHEYWLPALSRADFGLILTHRGVRLDVLLADRFYAAMQENALYLDLVARELAQADAVEPEQIIARVADNPASLFSLSLERLKRNRQQWYAVLKPILGLLLAARAPLSQRALRGLIAADTEATREGLERLGGLIQRDGEGCYGLFHLKLGEYLRQNVFASDEEESYHQQFVGWCEDGKGGIGTIWQDAPSDSLEQERRGYARQHYTAHLAAARAYEQLWSVIDAGEYGAAKRRHDPSTRSYALDLDIARQAVVDAAQAGTLPRIWRYSLLYGSLTSQADRCPEELFLALVALGRSNEAINLAELLSDLKKKVDTLRVIGVVLLAYGSDEGIGILQRARATADTIPDTRYRAAVVRDLTGALTQAQHWGEARAAADTISDMRYRAAALCDLAGALAQAQHWGEARATADAILDNRSRAAALRDLAGALTQAQHPGAQATFADARTATDVIPSDESRAAALCDLALALAQAQHPDAPATFVTARALASALPDDKQRAAALCDLTAALAQAQQWDGARATITALPDDYTRTEALRHLARALGQAQRWDEARATFAEARAVADSLPDDRYRGVALCDLAAALGQAQHPDAPATFAAARAVADALPDDRHRAVALSHLALTFAQAQRWDDACATFAEARDVANAIRDNHYRPAALRSLADALTQAQQWDDARVATDTLLNNHRRPEARRCLAHVLTQVQHRNDTHAIFATIRATADNVPNSQCRAAALRDLAVALTQTQHWDDIHSATAGLADDDTRTEALRHLARALAQAQRWGEARATIDALPDDYARADALCDLAAALAQNQHPDTLATFATARAVADALPHDERRADALRHIVVALAKAQRWDEARATIEAIPADYARAAALSSLAQALTQAHQWEAAYMIAHALPEEYARAAALIALAAALVEAQRWGEARATIEALPNDHRRADALRDLALALAQAQHPDALATFAAARAATKAIPDGYRHTESLSNLALALAQAQYPDALATFAAARSSADTSADDKHRAVALRSLAAALGQAQHWEEARAAADAIPKGYIHTATLSGLVIALARAQRWEEARATADAIPDDGHRAEAMHSLTTALSQAQHWEEARATADAIPDDEKRAWALKILAEALGKAERWQEAHAITKAILDDRHRTAALRSLVTALIQSQCWEEARATTNDIPDDKLRAKALLTLAGSLAQSGLLPQSIALLADRWRRAQTRDELLGLFVVPPELLRAYPELGQAFLDSFAWVDAQLAVG